MLTQKLGITSLEVSRIALGCMRLGEETKQAVATIRAALDQGITFFDHADIYGRGRREEVFAAIWDEVPSLRSRIVIQSKCGIRLAGEPDETAPKRYDFDCEHIVNAVEGSLRRLKTDYLDVLLLHRPDPLVDFKEVARAFDTLHSAGKVRHFGVSNHTAAQLRLLRRWVDQPLITNQLQLSLVHTYLLDEGIVLNRDQPSGPIRGAGTFEYCRMHDITVQAWAPLARGLLGGRRPAREENAHPAVMAEISRLAMTKGVSKAAIAIAWLLRHPAGIQPIVGTKNPLHIIAACQACEIELTRVEWYNLFLAGRGRQLP